jgi:hypothetical protein
MKVWGSYWSEVVRGSPGLLEFKQGHAVGVAEENRPMFRTPEAQRHGGMKKKRPVSVCPQLGGEGHDCILPFRACP